MKNKNNIFPKLETISRQFLIIAAKKKQVI